MYIIFILIPIAFVWYKICQYCEKQMDLHIETKYKYIHDILEVLDQHRTERLGVINDINTMHAIPMINLIHQDNNEIFEKLEKVPLTELKAIHEKINHLLNQISPV